MDKELRDKAVSIKGRDYILVADRVLAFNADYPNGSIFTELVENEQRVTVKATVTPDCDKPARIFTGYSQATWGQGMVNKDAATENAETSAVGRALGFMGIGVIDSVASADELAKVGQKPSTKAPVAPQVSQLTDNDDPLPEDPTAEWGRDVTPESKPEAKQSGFICNTCGIGYTPKPGTEKFSTVCVACYKKSKA